jgi:hypothetical protein
MSAPPTPARPSKLRTAKRSNQANEQRPPCPRTLGPRQNWPHLRLPQIRLPYFYRPTLRQRLRCPLHQVGRKTLQEWPSHHCRPARPSKRAMDDSPRSKGSIIATASPSVPQPPSPCSKRRHPAPFHKTRPCGFPTRLRFQPAAFNFSPRHSTWPF